MTVQHREEILDLLYRHTYPNVTNCSLFCKELCELISQYNNEEELYPGFFLETYSKCLSKPEKLDKLVFVQDNTSFQLIEEYYYFIWKDVKFSAIQSTSLMKNSQFKNELENIQLIENGEEITNYHFIKSHENRYIQVSDMLVGLLGKLFCF